MIARLKLTKHVYSLMSVLIMLGCSQVPPRSAVPAELTHLVAPAGLTQLRYFGDSRDNPFDDQYIQQLRQRQKRAGLLYNAQGHILPAHHLALSGGGEYGAFGAGVLNAWSKRGDRPEFSVVTGISTGAIISVFAFLGAEYDSYLTRFYTQTDGDQLFQSKSIFTMFTGLSLVNTEPFEAIVRETISADIIEQVAQQHLRGRLLLMGTTDLDSQRPVVWNMGELALSDIANKETLFEDIIIASSSVPGVFPAKMIDVSYQQRQFQELHVDGGITHQVFLFPEVTLAKQQDKTSAREHRVYIIYNTKLDPDYHIADASLLANTGRSIFTLLKYQGRGDVNQIYNQSIRYGFKFKLAYIRDDFEVTRPPEFFNRGYMNQLYQYGYRQTYQGQVWLNAPPEFKYVEQHMTE
ncbi:patatin-like phospholipase family protein [Motilimonas pumila]|uniref:PNPLA domain-containing protein n=1 Tax=Motilimonas pumila TaxID=2303987 RepID=A0A418YE54_9GAMM|nr:patatin-like phospholipase family protein [Motilimonas pumila]RJG47410.1 hypothetical protein D1Z90_10885 [Motilimonas pumila]